MKDDLAVTKAELEERDQLISEKGLVIVGDNSINDEEQRNGEISINSIGTPKKALVSVENAQLLESAGEGNLDVRLAKFQKEKSELQDQISHLKLELEEERSKRKRSTGNAINGPLSDDLDEIDVQSKWFRTFFNMSCSAMSHLSMIY